MEILLDRFAKKENYTISRVYVNGERFGDGKRWCSALEDTDRGLFQGMAIKEIYKRKKGKPPFHVEHIKYKLLIPHVLSKICRC